MKILITNDDGIEDRGLQELAAGTAEDHEVYIAAPHKEYTGFGGALTFDGLIGVEEFPLELGEVKSYKVYGTPADCVITALDELVGEVDLVLSGINNEPNIGDDIRFSGTLGACREAAFSGLPAVGLSLEYGGEKKYYQTAVNFTSHLLEYWEELNIPEGKYLNINFPNVPADDIKGVKLTKLGRRRYKNRLHLVKEKPYKQYRLHGTRIEEEEEGTDNWAVNNAYISITPLSRDNTDFEALERLKEVDIDIF